jgi:uncharacterized membrane protein HdeD (DUF308 family)
MTYQPPPGEGQPDPTPGYGQPPAGGYPTPPPGSPPPPPPPPPPAAGGYAPPPAAQPPTGGYAPPPGGATQMPPPGAQMPPAQQQWNAPPAAQSGYGSPASGGFDPKALNPMDWVILAMGPLALIFSFFSFYTGKVTVSFQGFSQSASGHENAWHGFFGWFGALVALLASLCLAIDLFSPRTKLPMPARLLALGGFALALICYLLAWFITPGVSNVPSGSGYKVDYGRGIGFYAGLLFVLIGLVLSFLRFQASGGKLNRAALTGR